MFEVWLQVIAESYPSFVDDTDSAIKLLHEAAAEWGSGVESPLAILFDQYVMLKTLETST